MNQSHLVEQLELFETPEQLNFEFADAVPGKLMQFTRPTADITFYHDNEPFLILHADGKLTIGSYVKPDEAAQLFLDTLARVFPGWLANIRNNPAE